MEYVPKIEVRPHINEFIEIIDKIRSEIKKAGLTFTYNLVGSAKRNLVVRHHNKGFDCDYQIIIQKNKKSLNAESIKKLFIRNLDANIIERNFNNCEDSSNAITIKKVDSENSKTLKSYDIVILVEIKDGYYIIHNSKNENGYFFESLLNTKKHSENSKKIIGTEMWNFLRQLYLKKKESNSEGKKSFQIYNEAVNETLLRFGNYRQYR